MKHYLFSYHISLARAPLVLLFSLILLSINSDLIFDEIPKSLFSQGFTNKMLSLLGNLCFLYWILFLSSFNKWFFRILILLLLFVSTLSLYVRLNYGTIIDHNIFITLIDQCNNINSVFDPTILIYLFCLLILYFILILKFKISKKTTNKKYNIVMFILLLISIFPFINKDRFVRSAYVSSIFSYIPLNYTKLFYRYCQYEIALNSIHNNQKDITLSLAPKLHQDTPKKIVLIIGESARTDHFSVNGYKRNTSPELNKIPNIVSFIDTQPCATVTMFSVQCMLSRLPKENMHYPLNENTIISVFKNLGFATSWLSTQGSHINEKLLLQISNEAQTQVYGFMLKGDTNDGKIYDNNLIPLLESNLKNNKKEFIVLHTMGSHIPFIQRYPKEFNKFMPVCSHNNMSKCRHDEIVNSYDNTIAYTDYFLSKVINLLKNQDAMLIYVSDHGQYLGENGIYGHGNELEGDQSNNQAHKVPMFLWMSDKMLEHKIFRKKIEDAKNNSKKALSHDNIFYSLLDCADISFNGNKNMSICHKSR